MSTVLTMRRRKLRVGRGRLRIIEWWKADWDLRDCEIAERLDAYPANVSLKRKKLGLPRPLLYKHPRAKDAQRERLNKVNWTLQDVEIAELLRLSPPTVNAARSRRRAGQAKHRGKWRRSTIRQKEWRSIDWRLQNWRIAKLLKTDPITVCKIRRALA